MVRLIYLFQRIDPNHVRFTERMRLTVIEDIDAMANPLVNRFLVCALKNNRIWTDGLLAFYEVFRFLEEAMRRSDNNFIKLMYNPVYLRTAAFEKDLDYFLRKNWRTNHKRNPATVRFIDHLQDLERNDPIMLLAYIYYLNQGLVAGAELLKGKRKKLNEEVSWKVVPNNGTAIIYYFNTPFECIRRLIRDNMNNLTVVMDEDTKIRLIEECKTVFLYSNEIIENIQRPKSGFLKQILVVAGIALLGLGISSLFTRKMKIHKFA